MGLHKFKFTVKHYTIIIFSNISFSRLLLPLFLFLSLSHHLPFHRAPVIMAPSAIRPQHRPRPNQVTKRHWRRRLRPDTWAFIPGGGSLEKRLQQLLNAGADDAVRISLDGDNIIPPSPQPTPLQSHLPGPLHELLQNNLQCPSHNPVLNSDTPSAGLDTIPNCTRSTTPEEHVESQRSSQQDKSEKENNSDDVDPFPGPSQELPFIGSQMSEGLEILLRASQESLENDPLPTNGQTHRAARRLWRSLEGPFAPPDFLTDNERSIPALKLLPR